MHTAELLAHESRSLKVLAAIAKFKRYKLPDIDQVLEELIQAKTEIHKLINSILNRDELPQKCSQHSENHHIPLQHLLTP
jgi:hypothetical protein